MVEFLSNPISIKLLRTNAISTRESKSNNDSIFHPASNNHKYSFLKEEEDQCEMMNFFYFFILAPKILYLRFKA